jgi:hypothetical protein
MNKEEKNKSRITSGGVFVDIFVGFLIAACIAGIVYRCFIYDPNVKQEQGEAHMVYFEILDAQEQYAKYLESGDAVYDTQTGLLIGKLAVHTESEEGSAVSVLTGEASTDELVVNGVLRSTPGMLDQGTLILDGTYMLTPGQELEIYTDTVSVSVRVTKIINVTDDPAFADHEKDGEIVDVQSE